MPIVLKARRKRGMAPIPGEAEFRFYRRLLGLAAIGLALYNMARLIGMTSIEPSRFDLMPTDLRVAVTGLALLYAAAGVGLWQLTRWGIALWLIVAGIDISLHAFASEAFGQSAILVALLCLSLLIMAGLYAVIIHGARKRMQTSR